MPTTTISGTTDTEDTQVRSGAADFNYGASTGLTVNGSSVYRPMFRIIETAIPVGSVTSASLFLYKVAGTGTSNWSPHAISEANSDYTEGTANGASQAGSPCWNYKAYHASTPTSWAGSAGLSTADTDYDSAAESTTGVTSTNTWYELPTGGTLIEDWRDSIRANGGVIIMSTGTLNAVITSSEYTTDPTKIPYWSVSTSSGVSAFISRPSSFNYRKISGA